MTSPSQPPAGAATDVPPEGPVSLVGQLLSGRYRVEKLLGEGGMGCVYLAEHTHMRKLVALKVLHPEMTRVPEVVARFEREAMAAAHMDHPHVAAATDFGTTEDGAFFLVLEYVDGTSLREVIAKGAMPVARALHVARQVATALVRAHEMGIVHRDLKPDNVMIVERGGDPYFVKVLDFGIAKVPVEQIVARPRTSSTPPTTGKALTRAGVVFGTPEYMAPEQALGQEVDARADLYAVGVILYEMLMGAPPFAADTVTALLMMQLTATPPPMAEKRPDLKVPAPVEAMVLTLLNKEANARPASAAAVVEAIDVAAGQSGLTVGPAVGASSGRGATAAGAAGVERPTGPWTGAAAVAPTSLASPSASAATTGATLPVVARLRRLPRSTLVAASAGVAASLALLLIIFSLLFRATGAPATDGGLVPAVANAALSVVQGPRADADEVARAAAAGRGALEQLAFKFPEDAAVARALMRAYHLEKQHALAARAAATVLRLDGRAAEDAEVLDALGAAAASGPEGADVALPILEEGMGSRGIDALYDLATTTKSSSLKTRINGLLLRPEARSRASKGTLLLIDLRAATSCDAKRALLPRARTDGDGRAYAAFKSLAATSGCGFLGLTDCFPCLRHAAAVQELKETLALLESRRTGK